jgi:hypothetical protein
MNEKSKAKPPNKVIKCHQCDNPAIFQYAGSIPLCADCYYKVAQADFMQQQATHNKLSWAASQLNYLGQQLYVSTGGLVPLRQAIIPKPPDAPININSFNQIKVSDSSVGVINTGTLLNIDTSISVMQQRGDQELANTIKKLTQAVYDSIEVSANLKDSILEQLEFILNEALSSKDNRRKGVVKTIINSLGQSLQTFAALVTIWNGVEPLLKTFFGI